MFASKTCTVFKKNATWFEMLSNKVTFAFFHVCIDFIKSFDQKNKGLLKVFSCMVSTCVKASGTV